MAIIKKIKVNEEEHTLLSTVDYKSQNGLIIEAGTNKNTIKRGLYLAVVSGYENGATLISIDATTPNGVLTNYKYSISYQASPGSTATGYVTINKDNVYDNTGYVNVGAEGANITLYQILQYV